MVLFVPESAPGRLPQMSTDRPGPSLAIVLPAFNEAERIGPALDELFGYLHRRGDSARDGVPGAGRLPDHIEVLVVDDGSTDETAELVEGRPEAKGQGPNGTTLRLLRVAHGGKGAAVRAGMLDVDADLIAFADSDMATPPDQLPLLVAALADHDVSLGSRIQPDGSDMRATQPGYRRLLGKIFHALASIWVVGPVQDTQCGFKGFTRAAAHDLFARQKVTSIVFDVELIYLARRRGYRMAIVPIRWYDKRGSRMRASPGLAARVAWDLLRIPFMHRASGRSARSRT
jgi:dolichyl-phosphate beta-glucosyltransferase